MPFYWVSRRDVLQLMTHYANDYFDYEAARRMATYALVGGSRVLVSGELSRAGCVARRADRWRHRSARSAGTAMRNPNHFSAVLLLCGMQVLAWSYSGPPLRLHSRGLGEPTTALVVPLLTPLAGSCFRRGVSSCIHCC